MAEKIGIENLKKVVVAAVDGIMCVDKLSHKDGVFSIFQYVNDFSMLGTVKGEDLKVELADLSTEERKQLDALAKSQLVLHDKDLEGKLESGIDCLESIIDFALSAYADVLVIKSNIEAKVAEGKALIEKIKGAVA